MTPFHLIGIYLCFIGVSSLVVNAFGDSKGSGNGWRFFGIVFMMIDFVSAYYLFVH